MFNTVSFSDKLCPLVFNNATIDHMESWPMTDTFIRKNYLAFINLRNITFTNDPSIKEYLVGFYNVKVNSYLINKQVFSQTPKLNLQGKIDSIDTDTFKNLFKTNCIMLRLSHTRHLLYNSIEWFNSINYDIKYDSSLDFRNFTETHKSRIVYLSFLFDLSDFWFSDNDFCLFKNFPFFN